MHSIGGVGGVDEKVKDAVHTDLRERALPHCVPGKNKEEVKKEGHVGVWSRKASVCVCRVSVLGLGCARTDGEGACLEMCPTSTLIKPTQMYGVDSVGFRNVLPGRIAARVARVVVLDPLQISNTGRRRGGGRGDEGGTKGGRRGAKRGERGKREENTVCQCR